MIRADQPTCFSYDVLVAVSSRDDGTMLNRQAVLHAAETVANRRAFCDKNTTAYEDVVYQRIEYGDDQSYARIVDVDQRSCTKYIDSVRADALITCQKSVGLFLPLADCIGLVLHDPMQHTLALVHMGRHSTLTNLITQVVTELKNRGTNPSDIIAWMSPHATKQSYRMEYFDAKARPEWQGFYEVSQDGIYLDLAGFNAVQLRQGGLREDNIHISPIDTVKSGDYYSHSAGDTTGRFAVLAMMR